MSPRAYARLFDEIVKRPDLPVVEVGAAGGAATVAIAWGQQSSGKTSPIITFEKCEGGSRTEHGDRETNLARLREHLAAQGVADRVEIHARKLSREDGPLVNDILGCRRIAALVHDADGRIDRDFDLFWNRLIDGGLIVVDDYEERYDFREISERYPDGGTKHLITYRLVNYFVSQGAMEIEASIHNTLFAVKPAATKFSRIDLEHCRRIVSEVHAERASTGKFSPAPDGV